MSKSSNKSRFIILFWVLFYLLAFFLLLHHSFSSFDPDLGWHLKVGQSIINTRTVPSLNTYNYTFTGHWVDHEWLSNVGLYWGYSNLGYIALNILFALIIVLTLILLNWYLKKIRPNISFGFSALFQLAGLAAALPHFGVRVQEIGVLFLVVLLIIISEYNRRRNWRLLMILPPFLYLWSNLHASFLMALFLGGAWVFIKASEKLLLLIRYGVLSRLKHFFHFQQILSWTEIFRFFLAWLISLGVTFLTPYGLRLYQFLAGYRNTFYLNHIQEWLSQFYLPLQGMQLIYLAFTILAIIISLAYFKKRSQFKLSLWEVFLLALFIFLAFRSRRNFPLMFVATFWIVIGLWHEALKDIRLASDGQDSRPMGIWLKLYLLVCLVLVSASQAVSTNYITDPFHSFCASFPCSATQFLKSHHDLDNLNLFNEYNWGGYMIWTDPGRKLFIDGRLPQVTWQGQSFLKDYYDFFQKDADFAKLLNKDNIGLVLLPSHTKPLHLPKWEKIFLRISDNELKGHNYLRDWLSKSQNWQLIFQDKTAVIYKRI